MSEWREETEKPHKNIDDANALSKLNSNDNILESDDENELGKRIRVLRNGQGLTIRELATKSSISVNTLSLIENGKTSPSVSTLHQIASALNFPITKLFDTPKEKLEIVFTKAESRPHALLQKSSLELLCQDLADNVLDAVVVSLPQGSSRERRPSVHLGYELVYCLSGKLLFSIEDNDYLLEKGDSLAFVATRPHQSKNLAQDTSRYLLVIAFPLGYETNILTSHNLVK
jgi:transcriptional regulator with XRE-family HTH domain